MANVDDDVRNLMDAEMEEEEEEEVEQPKIGWIKGTGNAVKKVGGWGFKALSKGYNAVWGGKGASVDPELLAKVMATRHTAATKSGGIGCPDQTIVSDQRSLVGEVLKQMGKNILNGRDLMYVTFPVRCSMPLTVLQLVARQSSFGPKFLAAAAATSDPVERLKLVSTYYVAGLHCTTGFRKPMNPILGETYQAQMSDGTQIFLEQTSHHPPISSWYVTGPSNSYEFFGWVAYSAKFGYNKFKVDHRGPRVLKFADGGEITFNNPRDQYVNLFWGEIRHETLGTMRFEDKANKLECVVQFQPMKGLPSDVCNGYVLREGEEEPICSMVGSWLGFVDWDDKRYWDIKKDKPETPIDAPNPLPSDSRFRRDAILLAQSKNSEAQTAKTELEEAQRRDRRLRKQYAEEQ